LDGFPEERWLGHFRKLPSTHLLELLVLLSNRRISLVLLTFIFLISTCAPSLLHLGRPANVCLDDDDAGMATILS